MDEDGRTVLVHPEMQMVRPMSDWVTAGFVAPGVRMVFGRMAPAPLTTIEPPLAEVAGLAASVGAAGGAVSRLGVGAFELAGAAAEVVVRT